MSVSKELKTQAIGLGLCEEWTDGWGNPTKEDLVDKYIEGLDFCIEHNYPSNEYIKKNFGEIAERKGVLVDKKNIDLDNPTFVVLNGDCEGTIKVDGFRVSRINVRHNSSTNIIVEEHAKVSIFLYDNANVTISNNGYEKAFVYQYGGDIVKSGEVLVRDKRK